MTVLMHCIHKNQNKAVNIREFIIFLFEIFLHLGRFSDRREVCFV
jgi:hypothetical protein